MNKGNGIGIICYNALEHGTVFQFSSLFNLVIWEGERKNHIIFVGKANYMCRNRSQKSCCYTLQKETFGKKNFSTIDSLRTKELCEHTSL